MDISKMFNGVNEERALNRLILEINSGVPLEDALEIPFIKNRIDTRIILNNPEVAEALLEKIRKMN